VTLFFERIYCFTFFLMRFDAQYFHIERCYKDPLHFGVTIAMMWWIGSAATAWRGLEEMVQAVLLLSLASQEDRGILVLSAGSVWADVLGQ
jgi:hypothetical protein